MSFWSKFFKKSDGDNELLMRFATNGDTSNLRKTLDQGVNPDLSDSSGTTALMVASDRGHLEAVELLLDRGTPANETNQSGLTSLMGAARNNHTDIIRLLVKHGAQVNARSAKGQTSLLMAAGKGYLQAVSLLLDYQADPNAEDHLGVTAVIVAAMNDRLDVLKELVARGGNISATTNDGKDCLIVASKEGCANVVRYLLESGADCNYQQPKDGVTAIMWAVLKKHNNVLQELLATYQVPNLSLKNKDGLTALALACRMENPGAVSLLSEMWRRTPFLTKNEFFVHPKQEWPYEVFISYKSEDVSVARHIAETLMSAGVNVWFAEYAVPLQEYDGFQEHVDFGCLNSRFLLFITNDRYASSEYCQREVENVLSQLQAGKRSETSFIEICLPKEPLSHSRYGQLANIPEENRLEKVNSVDQAVAFVMQCMGLKLPQGNRSAIDGKREMFQVGDITYSLDIGGWDIKSRGGWWDQEGNRNVAGPLCTATPDHHEVTLRLIAGPSEADLVSAVKGLNIDDDRERYRAAMEFGKAFFLTDCLQEPVGTHLIFVCGSSHAGFTTFRKGQWFRRYSIVLPSPREDILLEFALTFCMDGPFTSFCSTSHLFDRVAESLRIENC